MSSINSESETHFAALDGYYYPDYSHFSIDSFDVIVYESSGKKINIIYRFADILPENVTIDYSFVGHMVFHEPSVEIIVDSKEYSVSASLWSEYKDFRGFSEIDSKVYKELKKILAEKGLELQ